jgi:hypothetical protein
MACHQILSGFEKFLPDGTTECLVLFESLATFDRFLILFSLPLLFGLPAGANFAQMPRGADGARSIWRMTPQNGRGFVNVGVPRRQISQSTG